MHECSMRRNGVTVRAKQSAQKQFKFSNATIAMSGIREHRTVKSLPTDRKNLRHKRCLQIDMYVLVCMFTCTYAHLFS